MENLDNLVEFKIEGEEVLIKHEYDEAADDSGTVETEIEVDPSHDTSTDTFTLIEGNEVTVLEKQLLSGKSNAQPTRRAKNFTTMETEVLVAEVAKRRAILFGPLRGPAVTQFHRDRAWGQILNAVHNVASTRRTIGDLKKKFKDLKNRTKAKAIAFRKVAKKTGDAAPLNTTEEKILSFIEAGPGGGIVDGIDTFRKTVVNNPVPYSPVLQATSLVSAVVTPSPPCDPSTLLPSAPKFSEKKIVKKNTKTAPTEAMLEIKKTTILQVETNRLLGQFVSEFRQFKDEFLALKKRELELMEEANEIAKATASSSE